MATTPIVYSRVTQDVANETRIDQRFIGLLDKNRTRLNVHSALTKRDDKEDVFRFRVTRGGSIGFNYNVMKDGKPIENMQEALEASKQVRVEILDRAGRTIADSKATSGKLYDNYTKALTDSLNAPNGDYYVRVTRDRSVASSTPVEYSFQLRNGIYREDFDTTEKPPAMTIQTNPSVLGVASMASQLNTYRTSFLGEKNIFSTLQTLV